MNIARRRILLAGLEHERVAAREGVGEHPHRHHGREVERRDAGHHAERLLDAVHVDAAARPARCSRPSAGCGMPQANSMFSRPRATSPSASPSTLPCSLREQRGDLLAVGVDQLAHAEHDLGAARQVGGPPRRERRLGDGDRARRPRRPTRSRPMPAARRWPGRTRRPSARTCPRRPCRRSSVRCDSCGCSLCVGRCGVPTGVPDGLRPGTATGRA